MFSHFIKLSLCLIIAGCIAFLVGCQTNKKVVTSFAPDTSLPTFGASYIEPSEPLMNPEDTQLPRDSISPDAVLDYQNIEYLPISLSDCITRALSDSEVFRDLGGTVVAVPNGNGTRIRTIMDPAIVYTDPTFGEDAALSEFDANLASSLIYEKNDRPFNNLFSGNTDGILTQDLGSQIFEISKLSATGTSFTSRATFNYDHNNQAGNRYGHSWQAIIDSGFRQPLLQGAGSLFNRIAGPSQVPGQYNGVLIARTNTEIGLAAFEQGVREFVSNVENAYWDLYYGYRELNAQTEARDAAYVVYKDTEAKAATKRISDLELASAKEQYLRFESAVYQSLEGRIVEGTQSNSGSAGGSFRRTTGVRVAERRLRYLMGMPITDGSLLKPSDQPLTAPMVFDWDQTVASALTARPETRRQRWIVKQKELELTAARNFLLPRLDVVGNYRFRGLGKSLTGGSVTLRDDINNGTDNSAAFSDLASGDFQEVQIGAELRMPVGFRRANAAVRNAELQVQRARAVLNEQERKILLDLSNAVAECRRSNGAMKLAEQRYDAAIDYRKNAAIRANVGRAQFDVLLEAQRRILEAQLQFLSAEAEYAIALKNVRYEKATFLEYHGIALSESESNPQAYIDNQRRIAARQKELSYVVRDAVIGLSPLRNATGEEAGAVVGQGIVIGDEVISSETIGTEPISTEGLEATPPPTAPGVPGNPPAPTPATENPTAGSGATWTPLGQTNPADSTQLDAEKELANAIAQLTGENPDDILRAKRSTEPKSQVASRSKTKSEANLKTKSETAAASQSVAAPLSVAATTVRMADTPDQNSATSVPGSEPSKSRNSIGYFANQINFGDERPASSKTVNLSDTSRRTTPSTPVEKAANTASTISVLETKGDELSVTGLTDSTKKSTSESTSIRLTDKTSSQVDGQTSNRRVR